MPEISLAVRGTKIRFDMVYAFRCVGNIVRKSKEDPLHPSGHADLHIDVV